jgi:hypothetical protein
VLVKLTKENERKEMLTTLVRFMTYSVLIVLITALVSMFGVNFNFSFSQIEYFFETLPFSMQLGSGLVLVLIGSLFINK